MKYLVMIANMARKLLWKIRKPVTLGVKLVVLNKRNEVLLVKPAYQNHLGFPGGGINRGEHPLDAGLREIKEELGISLDKEKAKLFNVYINTSENKVDYIFLYVVVLDRRADVKKNYEIEKVVWSDLNLLPSNIGAATSRRISEIKKGVECSGKW